MNANNKQRIFMKEVGANLYIKALKKIPPDITLAIKKGYEIEESDTGRLVLKTILENIEEAESGNSLICQDTGTPVFLISAGSKSGFDPSAVMSGLEAGIKKAVLEHPLRASIVSVIERKNTNTAVGKKIPVVHLSVNDTNYWDITFVPKGSGSENMSYLRMLKPAEGVEGIKKFVIESVVASAGLPCPPVVVGIGLGGSADSVMLMAKEAAVRPVNSSNPDPLLAEIEEELLDDINALGIGPMGLGGRITALGVNIEEADTHISSIPVGINLQCWAARRASVRVWLNGCVEEKED